MEDSPQLNSEKGVALIVVLIGSLVVFVMVRAVLSQAFSRFNLSFLQTDHATAFYSSEAGVRFAFVRLEVDTIFVDPFFDAEAVPPAPGFANAVRYAESEHNRAYVISSLPIGTTTYGETDAVDFQDPSLLLGNRDVTLWIRADINGAVQPDFRVRTFSEYGD